LILNKRAANSAIALYVCTLEFAKDIPLLREVILAFKYANGPHPNSLGSGVLDALNI